MRALQWTDVNLEKRQLRVERNDWQGLITTTKGGRLRHIPMTNRLAEELRAHRHLRAARVLCRADASGLTESVLSGRFVAQLARRTCAAPDRPCSGTRSVRISR
jgi:integrase